MSVRDTLQGRPSPPLPTSSESRMHVFPSLCRHNQAWVSDWVNMEAQKRYLGNLIPISTQKITLHTKNSPIFYEFTHLQF